MKIGKEKFCLLRSSSSLSQGKGLASFNHFISPGGNAYLETGTGLALGTCGTSSTSLSSDSLEELPAIKNLDILAFLAAHSAARVHFYHFISLQRKE